MTTPKMLEDEVLDVLTTEVAAGKGACPAFMTAYQILGRLAPATRAALLKSAANHYPGMSAVTKACLALTARAAIEIVYLDTDGILFEVGGDTVRADNGMCALFRSV